MLARCQDSCIWTGGAAQGADCGAEQQAEQGPGWGPEGEAEAPDHNGGMNREQCGEAVWEAERGGRAGAERGPDMGPGRGPESMGHPRAPTILAPV